MPMMWEQEACFGGDGSAEQEEVSFGSKGRELEVSRAFHRFHVAFLQPTF